MTGVAACAKRREETNHLSVNNDVAWSACIPFT